MITTRVLSSAVAALSLVASVANAHPIHTTMTAITMRDGQVILSVRTFADDFSASVATFAGKTPPEDWSVNDGDVTRYVAARVQLRDATGALLTLRSCGTQRAGDVYQLCLRVEGVASVRGIHAENRLLTERHADQVNIVQVDASGARKTLLFTKRTASLSLADE